jgi:hypothetical protein
MWSDAWDNGAGVLKTSADLDFVGVVVGPEGRNGGGMATSGWAHEHGGVPAR